MADLPLDRGLQVLRGRGRIARGALITFSIISALTIVAEIGASMQAVQAGADELSLLDVANLVQFVFMIGCSVIVAMWIYRAHANLHAAGIDGLSYTPGWAVGWYFVPFANLVRPYQAMRELWAESVITGRDAVSLGGHLGFWWAAWLGGSVISSIGGRLGSSEDYGLSATGLRLDAVGTAITIASALLLARIIKHVTEAQNSVMGVAQIFE